MIKECALDFDEDRRKVFIVNTEQGKKYFLPKLIVKLMSLLQESNSSRQPGRE